MRAYFISIDIPVIEGGLWDLVSDQIEERAGPCDTGFGFGRRDIEIECADENDQAMLVKGIRRIFERNGFPYVMGQENWEERMAMIDTRSVDSSEDAHDEEISIVYGLIPPGVEE